MNKIICTTLLFALMMQLSLTGQSLRCDDVIFPACPGSGGGGFTAPTDTEVNRSASTSACSYTILQEPLFGTLTISGFLTPDNNIDSIFFYEPNSTCFPEDSFTVLECCDDNNGVVVCDTVTYMIHLEFVCETPPDKFCCLPANGQPLFLDVLENDQENLMVDFPTFSIGQLSISDITEQASNGTIDVDQATGDLIYFPDPGFTGVDSVTYEVFYSINDGMRDITICDEQTAYLLVENCNVSPVLDQHVTTINDTIYFDPTLNDVVSQSFEAFCPEGLECQNQLPQIALSSFELLTDPNSMPPQFYPTGTGFWCFTSPVAGQFVYDYQICLTSGSCDVGTIVVEVNEFCPPDLEIGPTAIQSNTYQAGQIIFSDGFIPPGNNVVFKAGEIIILDAGFRVAQQANFAAGIQGCGIECWDFNENGQCESSEDLNGDGLCDDLDCPNGL